MSNEKPVAALRVAQLDTTELDHNAIHLLSTRLQACFKYKIGKYDLMQVEPYLRTAMYISLLYFTLWKNGQSIGQKLLRLRYGDKKTLQVPSSRKVLLLQGILVYQFWARANKSRGGSKFFTSDFLQKIIKILESSFTVLNLLNFLYFLRQGHYQSLYHRLLGLRTVYVDPNPRKRTISFDLMNREFLWHGFAECGVFFLSLINVAKLKRNASELLFPKIMPDDHVEFGSCGFCDQIPVMPHEGACRRHVYCYYCVAVALEKDSGLKCPTCKIAIESIQPLPCRDVIMN